MSMMQTISLKLTNEAALKKAVDKLGWTSIKQDADTVIDADGEKITVHQNGDVTFYDMLDRGTSSRVNKLKARYGAEKAKMDARRAGYQVTEKIVNGKIKIVATEV